MKNVQINSGTIPSGIDKSTNLFLAGSNVIATVFADHEVPEAADGYILQPPRPTSKQLFNGDRNKLFFQIKESVFQKLTSSGLKPFIALDTYLDWSLSLSGFNIVFVMGETPFGTVVDVMVCNEGRVVDSFDRQLPKVSDSYFSGDLDSCIVSIKEKFPDHKNPTTWLSMDLEDIDLDVIRAHHNIEFIGSDLFRKPILRAVKKNSKEMPLEKVKWPLSFVAVCLVIYFGFFGFKYLQFHYAKHEFLSEMTGYEDSFRTLGANLESLLAKEGFLRDVSTMSYHSVPDQTKEITKLVASYANARILELVVSDVDSELVHTPMLAGSPAIKLTVSMLSNSQSGTDQIKPLLDGLSSTTGHKYIMEAAPIESSSYRNNSRIVSRTFVVVGVQNDK